MATIEPAGTQRTVLPGKPPFTVDDLLEFPDDGNRYELCDGSLLVSPAPVPLHQRIIFRLQRILDDALPPGLEPLSTVNLRVTDKDFYIPDLVVVPDESVDDVGLMFAPAHLLLAVEVGSPSTAKRDEVLKVAAYAEAGIPAYWRVEPDEGPSLYVYELDGDGYSPPAVYKAGTVARLTSPFPISFDPADLVRKRT
ncbi:Uma2 family endonuclease [Nonomuraea sp. NPDC050404]|uniref:Uma2 family endonuclease n=1 Tax=Nonomuraea sp. NPDC050404 TaxID=3155783 RepID=UPI0034036553